MVVLFVLYNIIYNLRQEVPNHNQIYLVICLSYITTFSSFVYAKNLHLFNIFVMIVYSVSFSAFDGSYSKIILNALFVDICGALFTRKVTIHFYFVYTTMASQTNNFD